MEPTYQSEHIGQLGAALAAAQSRFTFAPKTSSASMGMGKARTYADLQSVLDACRGPLAENGLSVTQTTLPCNDGGVTIRTMLIHKSDEWIAGELHLPPDKMGGIQGMGSAITYGRRYTYAAIVGIAQDDDDGECAQQASRPAQRKAAPKPAAPKPATPEPAMPEPAMPALAPVTYSAQPAPAPAEAPRLADIREEAKANNPDPPSAELRNAFFADLRGRGFNLTKEGREQTLAVLSLWLGRTIKSTHEITAAEIHGYLAKRKAEDAPRVSEPQPGYGTF